MTKKPPTIGWDWPLIKMRKGGKDLIFAKDPQGQLHRVTDRLVQDEAIALIKKIGPHS